ncbi:amidase family protein [Gloeomargaritales cyanobacterium VI4D9]|nr:amidase family protein [Gloeomargaritales cyanobacterium VI4D9]
MACPSRGFHRLVYFRTAGSPELPWLSLAAGLAVIHAVEDLLPLPALGLGIKWPNDVLLWGQKVGGLRVGVPPREQLDFFGNQAAAENYQQALTRLAGLGCTLVTVDVMPFLAAGDLLYEGAWLAERTAEVGEFLRQTQAGVDPVVRQIILAGEAISGVRVFQDMYRLAALQRKTEMQWAQMDMLVLPTTGTIYRVTEVLAEPIALNRNLGRYTNFVNLLDLCALALPSGRQPNGLPTGITLMARAERDQWLCHWGQRYQAALGGMLGATGIPWGGDCLMTEPYRLAVVGAHLTGQPLNYQLQELQARCLRTCTTAPIYRLYALFGGEIPKPGLVRQRAGQPGYAIEVEVWALSATSFGQFVAQIPSPLGIGTLILEDGETVKGFVCESFAVADALDISHYGGWRAYLAAQARKNSSEPLDKSRDSV